MNLVKALRVAIPGVLMATMLLMLAILDVIPFGPTKPRNHGCGKWHMATIGSRLRKACLKKLARNFWDVRNDFEFVAPTTYLEEALVKAIASDKKPFIISDMGDNPTAGGAGDVTWTLHELFKHTALQNSGKTVIYASIPGAELVKKAIEAGVGAEVVGTAGAEVDNRFAPPVTLKGIVTAIKEDSLNSEVVVKCANIHVIVTEKRNAYHYEKQFTDLGLAPREADILVVKIGYLVPELYDMRADWLMALTPGGVDQDLLRLPYKRVPRPIFPLDPNMEEPDLHARFIPLSTEPLQ